MLVVFSYCLVVDGFFITLQQDSRVAVRYTTCSATHYELAAKEKGRGSRSLANFSISLKMDLGNDRIIKKYQAKIMRTEYGRERCQHKSN